jgi:hypothetical protein
VLRVQPAPQGQLVRPELLEQQEKQAQEREPAQGLARAQELVLVLELELELGLELGPVLEREQDPVVVEEAPEAPVRLPPRLLQQRLHQQVQQFRRLLYCRF